MTLNELFAMKKNMAYQAKFEHRLSSMKKDFYHRRENLKQAIKSTVHEMKDIQSSTGYSLDEVRFYFISIWTEYVEIILYIRVYF